MTPRFPQNYRFVTKSNPESAVPNAKKSPISDHHFPAVHIFPMSIADNLCQICAYYA